MFLQRNIGSFLDKYAKQIRYLISGGLSAAIEFLSFSIMFYIIFKQNNIIYAQTVSYLIGLGSAFTMHILWTFKGKNKKNAKKQFILYTLIALVNLALSAMIIKVLIKINTIAWLAKIVTMGLVIIWNFNILNKYIFNEKNIQKITMRNIYKIVKNSWIEICIFLAILVIGLSHILIVRPGVGHDEEPHIAKAESTSRLDFMPHKVSDKYFTAKGSQDLYNYVNENIKIMYQKSNLDVEKTNQEIKRLSAIKYKDSPVLSVPLTGASGYNSINYIPNSIGLYLARTFNMTIKQAYYMAKLSALLFNAIIILISLLLLKKYRTKYLIAIIALYPQILFSFSGITTDGILNSSSILLAAILIKSIIEKSITGINRIVAVILSITISITKLPYLIIGMLIFFSPVTNFKTHKYLNRIILFAAITLIPIGWNYIVSDATKATSDYAYCCQTGVKATPKDQVKYILTNPSKFASSIANFIFDQEISDKARIITPQESKPGKLNSDFLLVYFLLIIIMSFYVKDDFNNKYTKKIARIWIIASIITFIGIIGALYVASNSVGQFEIWGVQTRYLHPLFPFLFIPLAIYSPFYFSNNFSSHNFIRKCLLVAVIINMLIATQLYIMPRAFSAKDRTYYNSQKN